MAGVTVAPYSPLWPRQFGEVHSAVVGAFAPLDIEVEHVGSTSVPGLVAKPVIDVLLGAASLAEVEGRIEALAAMGYAYVSRYELEIPARRYFVKAAGHAPRVHLHAVVRGSRFWREQLAFRDRLRSDPGLRAGYAALKLRLAVEFAQDKSAYQAAKAPFIHSVFATGCPPG